MNDERYMIAVDSDGNPYLAHSLTGTIGAAAGAVSKGVGKGVRTAHKYLAKVNTGTGVRYFYTPEEIQAYQKMLRNNAQQGVGYINRQATAAVSGVKNGVNSAIQNVNTMTNQAKAQVTPTAAQLAQNAAVTAQQAKEARKAAVTNAINSISEALGKKSNITKNQRPATSSSTTNANPAKPQAPSSVQHPNVTVQNTQQSAQTTTQTTTQTNSMNRPASHRKNITGTAKEGSMKLRGTVSQLKGDIAETDKTFGGVTASGKDYIRAKVDGELIQAAKYLDQIRTEGKNLEFEKARTQEALDYKKKQIEDLKKQPKTMDNYRKMITIRSEYKKVEKELDDVTKREAVYRKQYESDIAELETILNWYQKEFLDKEAT